MPKLSVKQIREKACEIVAENPGGIRFSALVERIRNHSPETPKNTISGAVFNLNVLYPNEIGKPSRGLFKPVIKGAEHADEEQVVVGATEQTVPSGTKVHESDFYQPFAQWLKNDLGEVTVVTPLGGAAMGSKWGTPDVVGVYKPLASQIIKFPLEIVSAELKIDPKAPVVAFGQAIAYRLFSSKTYVVMPSSLTEEDQNRLESLCMLFGVGFVLFDVDKSDPRFAIRVRAQRFSPDMFYVNEFAENLKLYKAEAFEQLFG